MDEITVRSWGELQDLLFADSWQESMGRFRSPLAFRGGADASADLRSGLLKLGGVPARQEGHLLRNFRKYAHRDAVPGDSVWNWLALAQHHGPRRGSWTGRSRRTWRSTSPPTTPIGTVSTACSGASTT